MRTLFLLLVLSLFARTATAQPETRGPYTVGEEDLGSLSLAGVQIHVVLYYPTDRPAPAPLVAVVHGFLRNGRFMAEMARTFASRGFIALVPDMPCDLSGCDHDANADQILALLEYGAMQGSLQTSVLFGRVDPLRRGAVGHSWGGLSTFLTSARASELDVAVLLDPQDDMGRAAQAAASVTVPTAHVVAQVIGSCNNTWGPVFPASPEPRMRIRVVGSGHCDVEEPSDNLCPLACGRGDPGKSSIFRRYAVAWVGCVLEPDPAYADYVGGAAFQADVTAALIDQEELGGAERLPCLMGGGNDAGVVADSGVNDTGTATTADAATPADAALIDTGTATIADAGTSTTTDAAQPNADAAAPNTAADAGTAAAPPAEDGCGCNTQARGDQRWAFLVALVLLWRRRR